MRASQWRTGFAPLTLELQRAVVDGDVVVIEAEGDGTTADGARYNNVYAYVMTVEDGSITSMREHCDTKLVAEVFNLDRDARGSDHP